MSFNPDLLVLDISMPILNGIEVASRLRESVCEAKVIFLTVHEDRDYVEAAFSVGELSFPTEHDVVGNPAKRSLGYFL